MILLSSEQAEEAEKLDGAKKPRSEKGLKERIKTLNKHGKKTTTASDARAVQLAVEYANASINTQKQCADVYKTMLNYHPNAAKDTSKRDGRQGDDRVEEQQECESEQQRLNDQLQLEAGEIPAQAAHFPSRSPRQTATAMLDSLAKGGQSQAAVPERGVAQDTAKILAELRALKQDQQKLLKVMVQMEKRLTALEAVGATKVAKDALVKRFRAEARELLRKDGDAELKLILFLERIEEGNDSATWLMWLVNGGYV